MKILAKEVGILDKCDCELTVIEHDSKRYEAHITVVTPSCVTLKMESPFRAEPKLALELLNTEVENQQGLLLRLGLKALINKVVGDLD